jgi:hypothetical protein
MDLDDYSDENADKIDITKLTRITSISDSDTPSIKNIFRHQHWSWQEGVRYLVGIYKFYTHDEDDLEIVTLSGESFRDPKDAAKIDKLYDSYENVAELWKHDTAKETCTPVEFVKWGLVNRDICGLYWLEDAQAKGYLPKSITTSVDPEKPLRSSEREMLLVIIAGILREKYKSPNHGDLKKVMTDIEKAGLTISANTLSKHYAAAIEILSSADREKASKTR